MKAQLYVVFSSNRKWWYILDDIIRMVEGVHYSHTAIMLHNPISGKSTIYELKFPKGRSIDLVEWLKEHQLREIFLIDEQFDTMSSDHYVLLNMVNKPYSIIQLLVIGFGMICLPFGRILSSARINGNRAKICTELVARFLSRCYGVRLRKSPDMMALKDTFNLVKTFVESKKRLGDGV